MIKLILYLFVFLAIIPSRISAQECHLSLEEILDFTSQEKFAIHSLYKVVDERLSSNEKIEVIIEGAISDPDFSFAMISMLPALQEVSRGWKLKFRYYRTNDNDVEEAKVIEAIRHLYPEQLFSYLITRAEESFEEDWKRIATSMKFDLDAINDFTSKPSNSDMILKLFDSVVPYDTYRVSVNDQEVLLLKEFFLDLEDERIKNCCGNFLKCYSNCIHFVAKREINSKVLSPGQVAAFWPFYTDDSNMLYFQYVACTKNSIVNKLPSFLKNSNQLSEKMKLFMLEDCTNKRQRRGNYNVKFCLNTCEQKTSYGHLFDEKWGSESDLGTKESCEGKMQIEWGKITN